MADFNNKNVLVTGGAGFIGSHLCDHLLTEPVVKIIAVDNLYLGKEENLSEAKVNSKFRFINCDVTNYESIAKIISDNEIDVIFHLAVIPLEASLENPVWCFDQNIKMTQNLLEIIRLSKRQISIIAYSSSEVYGTAIYTPMDENHPLLGHTPYAASKSASDLLVYSYGKTFGIDFSIVRPFNNFGPRQNEKNYAGVIPLTIRRIMEGEKPVIFDDGTQTRDFFYVKDSAYWTAEIYKNEEAHGQIINLASGKQIMIKDVIEIICKELKYSGEIERRATRIGDVRVLEGNVELAERLLNFKDITTFDQAIIPTIKWYIETLFKNK
ncbi:dTDP-glucose 4,6-dehydratase [Daejeonella sp.]|uniref:dTDP-glucose 4,6-dehydratase n=1 Tax=Daejeonella sp. TaxID=2805397 RepID=UPI00272FA5F2|nr:SDR family NAD(P)-dependent oxidoreductase [Daejeonella sp.]MDP2414344.1 SDR family NAD(P)-dependent oxidoreductase [Daejeonella sp.]